jgi:hypothetical protein
LKIATEVVDVMVAEVIKSDLVDVDHWQSWYVNLACFDEVFVGGFCRLFPRALWGGHQQSSSGRTNFMAGVRVLSFVGVACMRAPH